MLSALPSHTVLVDIYIETGKGMKKSLLCSNFTHIFNKLKKYIKHGIILNNNVSNICFKG